MDKSLKLANEVAHLLDGHDLDDVMPALAMILAHAALMTNIPKDEIIKFIDKSLSIQCNEHTRH
jgi:hypothetical protein